MTATQVAIRDFLPEDKPTFMEMAVRFYDSDAVSHRVEPGVLEATFDAAVGESPFIRGLMIADEGHPVGFGLLAFTFATEVGGMVVLLEDLFIDESCRGKGLGRAFFEFVWMQYPHAKRFRLELTSANTRAQKLYERLGFKMMPYVQMAKDSST